MEPLAQFLVHSVGSRHVGHSEAVSADPSHPSQPLRLAVPQGRQPLSSPCLLYLEPAERGGDVGRETATSLSEQDLREAGLIKGR